MLSSCSCCCREEGEAILLSPPVGDGREVICNELVRAKGWLPEKQRGKTIDSPLQEPFKQSWSENEHLLSLVHSHLFHLDTFHVTQMPLLSPSHMGSVCNEWAASTPQNNHPVVFCSFIFRLKDVLPASLGSHKINFTGLVLWLRVGKLVCC